MTATIEQVQSEWVKLIAVAQCGEEVVITRQGKAIARLTGIYPQPAVLDRRAWLARLAALRESVSAGKPAADSGRILDDLRSERG